LINIAGDDARSSKLGFIKSSGGLGLREGAALSNFNDKDIKNIKVALSPINNIDKNAGTEPSEREMFHMKKSFPDFAETVNNVKKNFDIDPVETPIDERANRAQHRGRRNDQEEAEEQPASLR
jgi:hypothetical protein